MRLEGWESRLAAVIEGARSTRYELGRHDCFKVACRAVAALTGIDRWPEWEGKYRTPREALRHIAVYGGTFDSAASKFFGVEASSMRRARRGDIVKFVDPLKREPHLGVCVGAEVAVLVADGLAFVPLSACECCWRIG